MELANTVRHKRRTPMTWIMQKQFIHLFSIMTHSLEETIQHDKQLKRSINVQVTAAARDAAL